MTREEVISTLERKYCENARFCGELYDFECQNIYCEIWWSIEALKNWEPVVRCKDCDRSKEGIQYKVLEGFVDVLVCGNTGSFTLQDGYCSNGRPKK